MLVTDALEDAIEQAFFSRDKYKETIEDNLRYFKFSMKDCIKEAESRIIIRLGWLVVIATGFLAAIKYFG
ncbi:MAG: hypothetical protein GWN62_17815, partial [Aliifodinibius sp.]|nr:hypothetical protein [Fodinibius sp.]